MPRLEVASHPRGVALTALFELVVTRVPGWVVSKATPVRHRRRV